MTERQVSQSSLSKKSYENEFQAFREEIQSLIRQNVREEIQSFKRKVTDEIQSIKEDDIQSLKQKVTDEIQSIKEGDIQSLKQKVTDEIQSIKEDEIQSLKQNVNYLKKRMGKQANSIQKTISFETENIIRKKTTMLSTNLSTNRQIVTHQKVIRSTYVMAFALSLVLSLLGFLTFYPEMTNWKNESGYSVPTLRREGFIIGPLVALPVIWFFIGIFHHSTNGLYEEEQRFPVPFFYAFSYLFFLSIYVACNYLLETIDASPWYHLNYDQFIFILFLVLGVTTANKARAYHWETKRKRDLKKVQEVERRKKTQIRTRKSSLSKAHQPVANLMEKINEEEKYQPHWLLRVLPIFGISSTLFILYPLIIIPVFNSDIIDDSVRMVLTTIVHMLIAETLVTFTRLKTHDWRGGTEHQLMFNRIIVDQIWAYTAEMYLSIIRRLMIGSIRNETYLFLTLAFTSIEEGILRSTFMQREKFWARKLGYTDLSRFEKKVHKYMCAVSIVNAMICEIVGIVASKVIILATRPNRFIFNVGHQEADLSLFSLARLLASELSIEFAVDTIATHREITRDRLPMDFFYQRLNFPSFFMYCFWSSFAILLVIISCFWSWPVSIYCSNKHDPCSCRDGPYRLYYDIW